MIERKALYKYIKVVFYDSWLWSMNNATARAWTERIKEILADPKVIEIQQTKKIKEELKKIEENLKKMEKKNHSYLEVLMLKKLTLKKEYIETINKEWDAVTLDLGNGHLQRLVDLNLRNKEKDDEFLQWLSKGVNLLKKSYLKEIDNLSENYSLEQSQDIVSIIQKEYYKTEIKLEEFVMTVIRRIETEWKMYKSEEGTEEILELLKINKKKIEKCGQFWKLMLKRKTRQMSSQAYKTMLDERVNHWIVKSMKNFDKAIISILNKYELTDLYAKYYKAIVSLKSIKKKIKQKKKKKWLKLTKRGVIWL